MTDLDRRAALAMGKTGWMLADEPCYCYPVDHDCKATHRFYPTSNPADTRELVRYVRELRFEISGYENPNGAFCKVQGLRGSTRLGSEWNDWANESEDGPDYPLVAQVKACVAALESMKEAQPNASQRDGRWPGQERRRD